MDLLSLEIELKSPLYRAELAAGGQESSAFQRGRALERVAHILAAREDPHR
jgi:hypothetical protein